MADFGRQFIVLIDAIKQTIAQPPVLRMADFG
jgi:hypothetical protein